MRILHQVTKVENGQREHLIVLAPDNNSLPDSTYTADGSELIVHNGTVHDATGSIGIPAFTDMSFLTMYRKPV